MHRPVNMEESNVFEVHLRVLEKGKKSRFLHFDLHGVPEFTHPEELKQFMLDNYANVLHPAQDTNFRLGYFIDGRGNKKFNIIDQNTLKSAYETHMNRRLSLWVDPHYQVQPLKTTKKKRKHETCK